MSRGLPRWVSTHGRSKAANEAREVEALTPRERWERFVAVMQLSELLMAGRSRQGAGDAEDPRSAESLALWKRLMQERPVASPMVRAALPSGSADG